MNQTIYEQLELDLEKKKKNICLSSFLHLFRKQAKYVFVNTRLDLIIYNLIFSYI